MKYSMTWANDSLGIPMFVSISSLGIALNQVSIEALGSPKKIIMGFDEEKKILGILPVKSTTPEDAKLYDLCVGDRADMQWIRDGCKGLVRYLEEQTGMSFKKTHKGTGRLEDEMLLLELDGKKGD